MRKFQNPLNDPNLTYKGKTAAERAKELLAEQKRKDLEARLAEKKRQREAAEEPVVEPVTPTTVEPAVATAPAVRVINAVDYLVLEDISWVDADDNVREHYSELRILKDIERKQDGKQISFTPYDAAVHFEKQGNGLFLPPFPLSCNIVAALFKAGVKEKSDGTYETLDVEIKKVLDQYKNYGAGHGYQEQNTIVDYGSSEIIHYPSAADFGQSDEVNSKRTRGVLSFDKSVLEDEDLESALGNSTKLKYVKQLTGLKDPRILVKIGKYFGRPAKLWFPWSGTKSSEYRDKRVAWLGCSGSNFNLIAFNSLIYNYAARGVFSGAAGAQKKFFKQKL